MTTAEITEYLKQATELEASLYRQEAAIEQTKKELAVYAPKKIYRSKPTQQQAWEPKKPDEDKSAKSDYYFRLISGIVLLGIAAVSLIFVPFGLGGIGVVSAVVLGFCGWILLQRAKNLNTNAKNEADYQAAMSKYRNRVEEYKRKYEKDLAEYNKQLQEAEEQEKVYAEKNRITNEVVERLNVPYIQTKSALNDLYALNVVFPKYRNMVAISTMYEYLASGRCSELTGADGAYNLYESELRQNIIIGELAVVITKLEEIKQNQYILYEELSKTNEILAGISSDMKELLETTHEISDATKITAFCSEATAKNTEAIKYISLVNG